jgi:uncharacterized protein (DUF1501 family)
MQLAERDDTTANRDLRSGILRDGAWPGLEPEQLHEGCDLALTTDFRAVFSEVAAKHLGASRLDTLFPGYDADPRDWLGIV